MISPTFRSLTYGFLFLPISLLVTTPADGAVDLDVQVYPWDTLRQEIALTKSAGTVGGVDSLLAGDTCYYAVQWDNIGSTLFATDSFTNRWYLDGNLIFERLSGTDTGLYIFSNACCPPAPPLEAGSHTIEFHLDYFDEIAETNEENNKSTRRFLVYGTEGVDFSPLDASNPQLGLEGQGGLGWSDRVVISTVPGTNTDAVTINSNQTIYVDTIGMNFGPATSTETVITRLKLNGVVVENSRRDVPSGIKQGQATVTEDVQIGPLHPGDYTLTYEIDPLQTQSEQNESNNNYSRTFTVVPAVTVVTNADPEGPGSLRQVVEDASSEGIVVFDQSLGGQTILLGGSAIVISKDLTIDASSLSDGVTVSGGNASQVFHITGNVEVTLDSLTITGGSAYLGGGIYVGPSNLVTLQGCTLTGNTSEKGGGALFSYSPPPAAEIKLLNCTVAGNSATDGPAGGLYTNGSTISLEHTTVVDNSSTTAGGGLTSVNSSILILKNSIVAGNSAPLAADIHNAEGKATISTSGSNLIGDNSTVEAAFPAGPLVGTTASPLSALLAPLGDYGGPTETMALLPGSPAIDTALLLGSTPVTDQIGNSRPAGGSPDIGAVEAFPLAALGLASNDGDTIPDILEGPGSAYPHLDPNANDSAVDTDGDGSTDAEELGNMTNLLDWGDVLKLLSLTPTGAFNPTSNPVVTVEMTTFPGLTYQLEGSSTMSNFLPIPGTAFTATGTTTTMDVSLPPLRGFVRVVRTGP